MTPRSLLAALCACVLLSLPARAGVWERLAGQHSGVSTYRVVVVEDDQTWRALWAEHQGSLDGLPEVDFRREKVVGVFLGLRSRGGHSVDIQVGSGAEGLQVRYEIRVPRGFASSVLTTPFALVKVPAAPVRLVPVGDEARAPRALTAPSSRPRLEDAAKAVDSLQKALSSGLF